MGGFGALGCLSAVLSVVVLTLLLQSSVYDDCSVDHDTDIRDERCDEAMGEFCDQSGAAEAWWAHNPQVPGLKMRCGEG